MQPTHEDVVNREGLKSLAQHRSKGGKGHRCLETCKLICGLRTCGGGTKGDSLTVKKEYTSKSPQTWGGGPLRKSSLGKQKKKGFRGKEKNVHQSKKEANRRSKGEGGTRTRSTLRKRPTTASGGPKGKSSAENKRREVAGTASAELGRGTNSRARRKGTALKQGGGAQSAASTSNGGVTPRLQARGATGTQNHTEPTDPEAT